MNRESATVPVGVKVVSGINVAAGALFVLGSFGAGTGAQAAALIVGGVVSVGVGVGLWRRSVLGRTLAMGAYAINVLVAVVTTNPIGLIVSATVLAYLWSAPVRAAFKSQGLSRSPTPASAPDPTQSPWPAVSTQ